MLWAVTVTSKLFYFCQKKEKEKLFICSDFLSLCQVVPTATRSDTINCAQTWGTETYIPWLPWDWL